MRKTEHPVVLETPDDPCSDSRASHPAYGEISASRFTCSPGVSLYGSDFLHGNAISITIRRSELHRSLSRDHYMMGDELIEVMVSEAQWASFVSNFNAGGTPCTLSAINRRSVPAIPPPVDVSEKYVDEMHGTVKDVAERLRKLATDPRLPKWAVKEAEHVHMQLTNSTGFIAEQFAEHIEETVEAARVEINAHAVNAVHRLGLEALAGGANLSLPPAIQMPGKGDK